MRRVAGWVLWESEGKHFKSLQMEILRSQPMSRALRQAMMAVRGTADREPPQKGVETSKIWSGNFSS